MKLTLEMTAGLALHMVHTQVEPLADTDRSVGWGMTADFDRTVGFDTAVGFDRSAELVPQPLLVPLVEPEPELLVEPEPEPLVAPESEPLAALGLLAWPERRAVRSHSALYPSVRELTERMKLCL